MARPTIYPWQDWLDGDAHVLKAGRDFPPSKRVSSLAIQIRQRAKDEGLTVKVTILGSDTLRIHGAEEDVVYTRYPWDKWLDGERHVITFGEIACKPSSLRQHAYTVARDKGKSIQFKIDTPRQMISIRSVGPYRPRRSYLSYAPTGDNSIAPLTPEAAAELPKSVSEVLGIGEAPAAPAKSTADAGELEEWPEEDFVASERPS